LRNFVVRKTFYTKAKAIQFPGRKPGGDFLRGLSLLQLHFGIHAFVGHSVRGLGRYLAFHRGAVQAVQQVIV
jgi:hypothetical protein